jgi:hypothetical protein
MCAQFGGQCLACFIAAAADNKFRAFLCEGQCGSATDAGERASDQNDGLVFHGDAPFRFAGEYRGVGEEHFI